LIIHQQKTRTPPRAKHIQPLYWQSRRLADKLAVTTWQHHLRAHNRMADALANMAMDSRRSFQKIPTRICGSGSTWDDVYNYASGDVGHWMEKNSDENSSEFVDFT
ncbi:hypothetical protein PHYSODRAFT_408134, partial [Phytophthora sojae]